MALNILGIKIQKEGNPISEPALYVSNHRSFPDPMIVSKYIDAYIIAKAEVKRMPVISHGAELTGIIYVNREDKISRKATRDTMIQVLKNGYNVLVYPEGTVNSQRTTMRFKTGTFKEAAQLSVPIVPIAIEYSNSSDLWASGKFLNQFFRQFGKKETLVKIVFGDPLINIDAAIMVRKTKEFIDNSLIKMQLNWSDNFN